MSSNLVTGKTKDFILEVKTILSLCEAIDSPRSLAVYLMLENGEYKQYSELSTDPNHYSLPSNFADDYLVTEALKKSEELPLNIDRKEAALSSFWDSELLCYFTNKRVKEESCKFDVKIRRELAFLLGPCDKKALTKIESLFEHGPGATYSIKGRGSVPSDKFQKTVSLTVELYPYAPSIMGPMWHNASDGTHDVVYGSKFTTVPKNAKTDRGICIEPTLNMFVQKGIGNYIRERLRLFGLNLSKQQEVNRALASRAWKDGLATIDLSMASDSLASNVVLSYLPPDWASLLSLPRCHRCFVDGEWHELEKFSSMGNGYTFELESLLFYAVCRAIIPEEEWKSGLAVYGDDLIVPRAYTPDLIETLNFLGFRVNTKKSFLAGSFFESCGSDWFKGVNVRPFYLKRSKEDSNIPYSVQIANKLRLYAWLRGNYFESDLRFKNTWLELLRNVPRMWKRARVPASYGDTGLISGILEARPRRARDGWEGYVVVSVRTRPVKIRKSNIFPYISSLLHGGATDFSKGREPRKGFLGAPILGQSTVPRWTDGLDWGS